MKSCIATLLMKPNGVVLCQPYYLNRGPRVHMDWSNEANMYSKTPMLPSAIKTYQSSMIHAAPVCIEWWTITTLLIARIQADLSQNTSWKWSVRHNYLSIWIKYRPFATAGGIFNSLKTATSQLQIEFESTLPSILCCQAHVKFSQLSVAYSLDSLSLSHTLSAHHARSL